MVSTRERLRALKSIVGNAPPWDTSRLPADPAELFLMWLNVAIAEGVSEAHAMTLSTVAADGMPDARIVILKDVTENGLWCFAGSSESAKGVQLAANPVAALTFYWSSLARSVRFRGRVSPGSHEASVRDFDERRPTLSATSPDRERSWILWQLRPEAVEFWSGDPGRRHARVRYHRDELGSWSSEVISE